MANGAQSAVTVGDDSLLRGAILAVNHPSASWQHEQGAASRAGEVLGGAAVDEAPERAVAARADDQQIE